MRFLFIILFPFTLNSCGNLMSASLIESFLTPTSAIMSAVDYGIEKKTGKKVSEHALSCLLYTSPSPRDRTRSRMPSSA